ncbi:hypothetical protein LPB140_02535 [Sphingorhabdus lutea]|uniref:LPXTG cell wall anchor domain-containing protein n=1 Tax=Sphingorhabdus lutea TaxID=1913578 RepID=A0A1L3J9S8_9SPHN|nr:hypothetical protein [Sphingorhabdus lutea]APG61886.1 hypothetical protein LPB140_02535 [Sphingorhabdus lutea]
MRAIFSKNGGLPKSFLCAMAYGILMLSAPQMAWAQTTNPPPQQENSDNQKSAPAPVIQVKTPQIVGPRGPVDVDADIADRPAPTSKNNIPAPTQNNEIERGPSAPLNGATPPVRADVRQKNLPKSPNTQINNNIAKDEQSVKTAGNTDPNAGAINEDIATSKITGNRQNSENIGAISPGDIANNNGINGIANSVNNNINSAENADIQPFIYGGLALLLLVIGFAAYRFLISRRATKPDLDDVKISPLKNTKSQAKNTKTAKTDAPPSTDAIANENTATKPEITPFFGPANPPSMGQRPWLNAHFQPEKALLTLTSLRLSGEIIIDNQGDLQSDSAMLRILFGQADEGHEQILASFHHDELNGEKYEIPVIKANAQYRLKIDLAMPITAIKAMEYGPQRFIVPMIAADLRYYWPACDTLKGEAGFTNFAHIVGLESTPACTKMAPLRLDKGPCNYGTLGQRAIATQQNY